MPSCAVWNAVNYLYYQRRHRRRRRHRCCCWCSCSISSDCASITRFFLLRFSPAQWNRMRLFYRVQNVLSIYQRWFVIPCANFGLFDARAQQKKKRSVCGVMLFSFLIIFDENYELRYQINWNCNFKNSEHVVDEAVHSHMCCSRPYHIDLQQIDLNPNQNRFQIDYNKLIASW